MRGGGCLYKRYLGVATIVIGIILLVLTVPIHFWLSLLGVALIVCGVWLLRS